MQTGNRMVHGTKFRDRREAGRVLAQRLGRYAQQSDALVLALPRGGVPVAYETAHQLQLALDVFIVRKIGVPGRPELAMGAVASDGTYMTNREVIGALNVTGTEFLAVFQEELAEARRREEAYREGRPGLDLAGKTVILIDDGLATGSTMHVAIDAVRRQGSAWVVVAVPVAPAETQASFRHLADEMVSVITPHPFYAVGAHYRDFQQTSDAEVCELLARAFAERNAA
jgi:putative phosphoribosyl transferase